MLRVSTLHRPAAVAAAVSCLTAAAILPAACAQTIPNGAYALAPAAAARYRLDAGAGAGAAATPDLRMSRAGSVSQVWVITWMGNGYKIQPQSNTGLALTAAPTTGALLQPDDGGPAQRWTVTAVAGRKNRVTLVPISRLDVRLTATTASPVTLAAPARRDGAQTWTLMPAPVGAGGGVNGTTLTFKGRNFFPIGIYDYPGGATHDDVAHFPQIADDGFNAIHLFDHDCGWPGGADETCTVPILQRADRYGLAVVDALYRYNRSGKMSWLADPAELQVGSEMYRQLQLLGSQPALLAWEHIDENGVQILNFGAKRAVCFVFNPEFRKDYEFVKRWGGGKPVWFNDGPEQFQLHPYPISAALAWARYCDAYSNDIYPYTNVNDINTTVTQMDWTVHCTPDKPHWIILNAGNHDHDQWGRSDRFYMAYTAIIHGARGVWWWGAWALQPTETPWSWIVEIAKQLRWLERPLADNTVTARHLTDTYTKAVITEGCDLTSPSVECLCFAEGKKHYLILSNTSAKPATARLSHVTGWRGNALYRPFGGPAARLGAPLPFAGRQVEVFTDFAAPAITAPFSEP